MKDELEKAKQVILNYLDESLIVKNTKWIYDFNKKEYIEVDAGFTKEELETMQHYRSRDMGDYYKLRDLLYDLI